MDDALRSPKAHFLLKLLFGGIPIAMIYVTVVTSMQSSLIKDWNFLGSIPWMRATLFDFYFNITILSSWMFYKEKSWGPRLFWLVLFVVLGSIATSFYVWLQLMRLQPGDSAASVLVRRPA